MRDAEAGGMTKVLSLSDLVRPSYCLPKLSQLSLGFLYALTRIYCGGKNPYSGNIDCSGGISCCLSQLSNYEIMGFLANCGGVVPHVVTLGAW